MIRVFYRDCKRGATEAVICACRGFIGALYIALVLTGALIALATMLCAVAMGRLKRARAK